VTWKLCSKCGEGRPKIEVTFLSTNCRSWFYIMSNAMPCIEQTTSW